MTRLHLRHATDATAPVGTKSGLALQAASHVYSSVFSTAYRWRTGATAGRMRRLPAKISGSARSGRAVGLKRQRHAIHAVAQPGRRRAVLEYVPEMAAAAAAMHLG